MSEAPATRAERLWTVAAALLTLTAAALVALRLLLPALGAQRESIEAWVSAAAGHPVALGAVTVTWHGWTPTLSVSDVAVLDSTDGSELVRFRQAAISVAPLASLISGALKPDSLRLSGIALTLIRDSAGRFRVAGLPPPKAPLVKWLIAQNQVIVTEADVTIVDERAQASFALADLAVAVRNRDRQLSVDGSLELPDSFGGRLRFALRADDNPLEGDWAGTLDVRLEGIKSAFLARQAGWQGPPPPAARVDLQAWSQWTAARLAQARFTLTARDPSAPPAVHPVLSGDGRLTRRGLGWHLELIDLVMPAAVGASAPAALSAAWQSQDGRLRTLALRGARLPLAPLAVVAGGLAALPADARERLAAAAPRGSVRHLEASWAARDGGAPAFYADATLAGVQLQPAAGLPAVTGLGFATRFNRGGGYLRFDREFARVDAPARFVAPLEIAALDGSVAWRRSETGGIDVHSPRLGAVVNGTALALSARARDVLDRRARTLDLLLDISRAPAASLHELLPRAVLPARGEQWLRGVLEAGTVKHGRVLVRGPLAAFPFAADEGVLRADFELEDATVHYSPQWPQARELDATLAVRGPRVHMQVADAAVLRARVAAAEIELPDLFAAQRVVHITGTARGPASSAGEIIMASPLAHGKAARVTELDIDGELEVTLDMNLALYPDGPREVLGQAHFDGNRIRARAHDIALDEVVGSLSFTRADWYGEGLSARFDGRPVELVVNGGLADPNYDSELRMRGSAPAALLEDYLQRYAGPLHDWLEHSGALHGELPWTAVLTLAAGDDGGPTRAQRLTLESSLRGLALELPAPLGKPAAEPRPLRLEFALDAARVERVRVDFGDLLDAELALARGGGAPRIERAEIVLGALDPEFTGEPGVQVRGYLAHLPLAPWAALLSAVAPAERAEAPAADAARPLRFDVQISRLDVLGREFRDVRLHGARAAQHWQVAIASPTASGSARIPRDAHGVLGLELDRLHLARRPAQPAQPASARPDPRRFPDLEIAIGDFVFDGVALGRTRVSTRRRADGLELAALEFDSDGFTVDATGAWLNDAQGQHSRFDIDVTSETLAALLERFGYTVANIKGGRTTLGISARWPGTPGDFTLARLDGQLELDVRDGRFLDIDPGGGRLFGLLSLQTLPRRLALDFSDIFRKGFAFDTIEGSFRLDDGNAYTNSLYMEGPSARIDVSGRTGLEAQDYDQHVIVTPALSSSIPVAGALFGPIGIGAGAVYYLGQKMFKSIPEQIDKLLSREYTVTGSWQDPAIERI